MGNIERKMAAFVQGLARAAGFLVLIPGHAHTFGMRGDLDAAPP